MYACAQAFSLMAVPEALVLGCHTHGPAPWVSCMAARGEERRRKSAKVQCAARHCEVLPWVLCGTEVLTFVGHKSAGRSK